jgi:hypothetical protein
MTRKVAAAIKIFRSRGHTVVSLNRDGTFWYEIDGRMLASSEQMEELGNRVVSLIELEEVLTKKWSKKQ